MAEAVSPYTYLKLLQQFPHRGLGTKYANQAVELIKEEFQRYNLKTTKINYKTFCYYWIYSGLFCFTLALSSLFLFTSNYPLVVLSLIAEVIIVLLFTQGIRVLPHPKKTSDVYAEILPKEKVKNTVVILAHYDTANLTLGLKFAQLVNNFERGNKYLNSFHNYPFFLRAAFSPVYLVITLWIVALVVNLLHGNSMLFVILNGLALFLFILNGIVFILPTFSPYVPGAFDNGSGTAVVISLAPYFSKNKLQNTRLILLCDGAEEGSIFNLNGFEKFFKEANINLTKAIFINLDGVGGDKLYAAYEECGYFGFLAGYDKSLFPQVQELLDNEFKGRVGKKLMQVPTDAQDLCRKGARVMTTLTSSESHDYYDHYHQMTDTIDKVKPEAMELSRNFLITLIQKFDQNC